jgi:transposase
VRRHELTDEQWQAIEPLLPPSGTKGRPRADDRRVIDGMLHKAKTGIAWRDLPERHGPWKTIYTRFWRRPRDGTLTMLVAEARAIDELDREVSVDSSIAPAAAPPGAGRRCSTPVPTSGATRSSGASTGSSSTGPSPPATTRPPSPTKP